MRATPKRGRQWGSRRLTSEFLRLWNPTKARVVQFPGMLPIIACPIAPVGFFCCGATVRDDSVLTRSNRYHLLPDVIGWASVIFPMAISLAFHMPSIYLMRYMLGTDGIALYAATFSLRLMKALDRLHDIVNWPFPVVVQWASSPTGMVMGGRRVTTTLIIIISKSVRSCCSVPYMHRKKTLGGCTAGSRSSVSTTTLAGWLAKHSPSPQLPTVRTSTSTYQVV